LIGSRQNKIADKIPGLGDLPMIGRLFGSQKDERNKTEIVLLITPYIVRNIDRPEASALEFDSPSLANEGEPVAASSIDEDLPRNFGEYELLEKLIETGLIGIFENVQVQFHDVAPDSHSRMERIQKALGKTHTPTYQYEFVWENWTRRR